MEGPQRCDIVTETDAVTLFLAKGDAVLSIDGDSAAIDVADLHGEYPGLYRRFAATVRAGLTNFNVSPLRLVADIFLRGRIYLVEPFVA